MNLTLTLDAIGAEDRPLTGGKAYALGQLSQHGMQVPPGICVTVRAYDAYVADTGLRERIMLELNRKPFKDMRWEEMWDASLRIRNMFATTPIPAKFADPLRRSFETAFNDQPVCVRSSSIAEDSSVASFAGLHDSYVNVCGVSAILEHVQLVWASLWSDAALLYRRELDLAVDTSSMAVVVQALVNGDRSGVAFSKHPHDASQAVVEAVHGLNEGLVSGLIEPDRWIVERDTGRLVRHDTPERSRKLVSAASGVEEVPLLPDEQSNAPLTPGALQSVYRLVMEIEAVFGSPQDTEWTWRDNDLYLLQSRPVTATSLGSAADDQREWCLSLRRSLDNLCELQVLIESQHLPAMTVAAEACSDDLAGLNDSELAVELDRRIALHENWHDVYWRDFIPFAHGMRLFGQVYNDTMRPEDPYAFMDLLLATPLLSLERNRRLTEIGRRLAACERDPDTDLTLCRLLDDFEKQFGGAADGAMSSTLDRAGICRLAHRLAAADQRRPERPDVIELERRFLESCNALTRDRAQTLLAIGRASYRLRDDDNLYLGRIEAAMLAAATIAGSRLASRFVEVKSLSPADRARALCDPSFEPTPAPDEEPQDRARFRLHVRQLTGQPAGAGLGSGPARIIDAGSDLTAFEAGEILVCDAIQPHMTIIVPLAAGIVERRGGMLIHGAIIAREYGLPCVTGVPDATELIRTGDHLTVDGYLGIVINSRAAASRPATTDAS